MTLTLQLCLFVLVLQRIYCANITVQPVSINTTLNSTVIFTCEAIADELTFRVNNVPASHEEVILKGFTFTLPANPGGPNGTLTGRLQAIAYNSNNNTDIRCRASNDGPPATVELGNTSVLLIQGLLASVGDLTVAYINDSSVNLSWTAPYTLDNVPITGYYINDNSGRILNTTDSSYILSSSDPDVCDMTNVTVSAVNGAGIGQPANTSFYYNRDFLGPDIDSSIDNCSNISITWNSPKLDDCRVSIEHYLLTIYDDITGIIVDNYTVYDTSYLFEDEDLFIHRYTYVITAVNKLGDRISNNNTFSYQRVPRSARESTFKVLNFTENNATIKLNIPVTLECTGEVPENATITIECNGTEIFTDTCTVEYARRPMNITGSVSVPQNQECILSIVFSNQVGSSEPFTLTLNTTPPTTISPSPSPTSSSVITVIGAVSGIAFLMAFLMAMIIIVALLALYFKKRNNNDKGPNDNTNQNKRDETKL